jgi:hypothetical protein
MLRLSVEPAGVEARVTVNNQERKLPIDYKVTSDTSVTVDVEKAAQPASSDQKPVSDPQRTAAVNNLNIAIKDLNDLNTDINGDICGGGSGGIASPVRGRLSAKANAISDKLRDVSLTLSK